SILFRNSTCGMLRSVTSLNSGASVMARSTDGSNTMTATSATISALMDSWNSSIEPGQSMNVHLSPRYSQCAAESSVLICRLRASAVKSPTEFFSLVEPLRGIAPQTDSSDSSSVVLPLRYGPTRAAQRGPADEFPAMT